MSERLTKNEFIYRCLKVHGYKYDYSKVNYIDNRTKVQIICPIHGLFFQRPNNHISQKNGCPKCKGGIEKTTEEFINKAVSIHKNKYDYSEVKYKNSRTKIKIICPEHGIF
ncbi:MAG: DUF723 domain-containing protein [Lachnospiraceae bacterium]|jgi:flavorubredoxin|nr:DUF723 domain-containing protein [Lachnospiraceae bacterium]